MSLEMERRGAAFSEYWEQKEPNSDREWGPGEGLVRKLFPVMGKA